MPDPTPASAEAALVLAEATPTHAGTVALVEADRDLARAEVAFARETISEAFADAEMALEDRGWKRVSLDAELAFTREGLRSAAQLGREMCVLNALVRRGVALRIGYVWGSGVQVVARSTGNEDGEQDVNAVVQAFLDDELNRAAFAGEQAREESERELAATGNLFWALFTRPTTGKVQVRSISFDEIRDVITNPDDRTEPWFYFREWQVTTLGTGEDGSPTLVNTKQKALYPALGYRPRVRQRVISGVEVRWDSPMLHTSVNRPLGWKFGIPDVYAALPWARAYSTFLSDWAQLVKALSKFAWQVSNENQKSPAAKAAQKIANAEGMLNGRAPIPGVNAEAGQSTAGAMFRGAAGTTLEAVPKTGATIDSGSGRPLAAMVASALDLPVTMLLGDPGVTGARATAETLDEPTKLSMSARRIRRGEELRAILAHVIRESVRAPQGDLKGRIIRDDFDREVVVLPGPGEAAGGDGTTDATIDVNWPPLEKVDPVSRIQAIVAADSTQHIRAEEIARLLLAALEVDDVDAVMAEMTDPETGEFLDPAVAALANAGQAAVDAFRQGRDPVATLTGEPTRTPPADDDQDDEADDEETPAQRRTRRAREAAADAPPPVLTRRRVERDAEGRITGLVDEIIPNA